MGSVQRRRHRPKDLSCLLNLYAPGTGGCRAMVVSRNNPTSQTVLAQGTAVSVDRFASQDLLYRPGQDCHELRR